jgi:hypothetical protein
VCGWYGRTTGGVASGGYFFEGAHPVWARVLQALSRPAAAHGIPPLLPDVPRRALRRVHRLAARCARARSLYPAWLGPASCAADSTAAGARRRGGCGGEPRMAARCAGAHAPERPGGRAWRWHRGGRWRGGSRSRGGRCGGGGGGGGTAGGAARGVAASGGQHARRGGDGVDVGADGAAGAGAATPLDALRAPRGRAGWRGSAGRLPSGCAGDTCLPDSLTETDWLHQLGPPG